MTGSTPRWRGVSRFHFLHSTGLACMDLTVLIVPQLAPAAGVKGMCAWAPCWAYKARSSSVSQEPLHAVLRSRGTMSRDEARLAERRRGSCIANQWPKQRFRTRGQLPRIA